MNLIGLKCSDTVYVTEAFYQCWDFSCVQPFAAKHRLPSWYLNPKRALNFKRLHLVTSAVQIRLNSRQKMFFLLSVQAGISMSASVCLLVTLSKWIHQICLICVLTLKLLAITSLELTSQKPRWKRVFCGHENLVLTPVWPRPRSDGCLLRSG